MHVPICFYGDDFTGAAAHLAGFYEAGLCARLFLRTPTHAQWQAHAGQLAAVGVAGIARSLELDALDDEIRPTFELFQRVGARQIQYKVCSTFDSSPRFGSIGRVLELGRQVFGTSVVPVLPADPRLGRYTLFGNHYARASDGLVYRLDRHPSLSCHPATPMHEADLRRHLASQTSLSGGLIDITVLRSGQAEQHWQELCKQGAVGYAIFDVLDEEDLDRLVPVFWRCATLFTVSSQGLALALGRFLAHQTGIVHRSAKIISPVSVANLLVLSGSASELNSQQLHTALAHDWFGLRIDLAALLDESGREHEQVRLTLAMRAALRQQRSVVVYSAIGADEIRRNMPLQQTAHFGGVDAIARVLGELFARLLNDAVQTCGLRRVILAGGDTSGHTLRHLDADALEIIATNRHGGRLCRLLSGNRHLDGLEIMLKGGQIGNANTFVEAASARVWAI